MVCRLNVNSCILLLISLSVVSIDESPVAIFNVTYNATVAGDYTISVANTLTGSPISGSPFNLKVVPGPTFGPVSLLTSNSSPQEMIFQAVDSW